MLPDFPHSSTGSSKWLLTEDERAVAVLRMKRDRVSDEEINHSVCYGLKLAVADYRTWIFVSGVAPGSRLRGLITDSSTGGHAHCEPHRVWFRLFLSLDSEGLQTRLKHHRTSSSLHLHIWLKQSAHSSWPTQATASENEAGTSQSQWRSQQ